MYKIRTKTAPGYLNDKFSTVNSYNLRESEVNFNLPLPKTEYLKRSFLYQGPKLWNSLSTDAKNSKTLLSFKNKINNC